MFFVYYTKLHQNYRKNSGRISVVGIVAVVVVTSCIFVYFWMHGWLDTELSTCKSKRCIFFNGVFLFRKPIRLRTRWLLHKGGSSYWGRTFFSLAAYGWGLVWLNQLYERGYTNSDNFGYFPFRKLSCVIYIKQILNQAFFSLSPCRTQVNALLVF